MTPIEYADLKRIITKLRCDGMTEADVMKRVCWILNGLTDRFDGDE